MTRRVDRRPARAWLVAALALAACGDRPGVEPSGPSAVQIPLSVVEGDWPDADESVALTVEIADSGAAAIAQKAGLIARVVEPGDVPEIATRCVAVKPGKPPVVIEVPLEADLADFDLVRLRYATLGFLRVAAVVAVDSKETYRSEDAERNRTLDPETIEFDLSALDGRSGSIDRIELHFQEMTHQSAFFDLELVRRSAAARLPSPLQPPPHVAIGNGSREATGLLPGVVLGGPIDAPAAGSIAIEASAEERFGSAAAAEIRVALVEGGDQLAAKTFEVGAEWTTLTLPFERSRSEPVELRVTSETDGGALVGTARWLAAPEPDRAPRTVLFITSDTHRADYVGYADGGPGVRSPMIDSLAERGTRFENAVSATSITNPSHASMFTGLSVRDTGIVGNVVQLSERANTLAEAYREAGFRTFAAVSARHMIPWRSGFGQGFERYDAPARRAVRDGADTIDAVYAMLEDAGAHDVFLWLHLFEAHAPYRLHEDFTPLYYEGDPYSEELDELAPEAQAGWDRRIRDKEYVLALYRGEVTYLDRLIDGFFERAPRMRTGWTAFTSDHGEALGAHGMYWTHTGLYPDTLRVPLVLAGPGVPEGRVVKAPVSNTDVARTLLEVSGVIEPDGAGPFDDFAGPFDDFAGASLLSPEILDDERKEPRFVIGQNGNSAAVFHEGWYLLLHIETVNWGNPPGAVRHSIELYDLNEDPGFTTDVADEHPERARRLRRALVAWLNDLPPDGILAGAIPGDPSARDELAALGYAVNEASAIEGTLIDPDCDCAECEAMR